MELKKYEMSQFYKLFHYFLKTWFLLILSIMWFIVLLGEPNLNNSVLDFIIGGAVVFVFHVVAFYYVFRVPVSILIKGDKIKFNLLLGWGKEFDKEDIYKFNSSKNFLDEDVWLLIKVKNKMIKYRIWVKYYRKKRL